MKKNVANQKKQTESDALRLHREAYEKRLRRLKQLDDPGTENAADETEENDRESEEEALLTNA
jgi:hypothetical protein